MPTWYFTFGEGQKHEGYCQPIIATGRRKAREAMCRIHGNVWESQYSESVWEDVVDNGKGAEELATLLLLKK
jgi:hypothetical protein